MSVVKDDISHTNTFLNSIMIIHEVCKCNSSFLLEIDILSKCKWHSANGGLVDKEIIVMALEIIVDLYEFSQLSLCLTAIHGCVLCIMSKTCVHCSSFMALCCIVYSEQNMCISSIYKGWKLCIYFFVFKIEIGDGRCEHASLMSVISDVFFLSPITIDIISVGSSQVRHWYE